MTRIAGVSARKAGLLVKIVYGFTRRGRATRRSAYFRKVANSRKLQVFQIVIAAHPGNNMSALVSQ